MKNRKIPLNKITTLDYAEEYSSDLSEQKLYKKVMREVNKEIRNLMIREGFLYRIPQRLGWLAITRTEKTAKSKVRPVNWKVTKEINKKRVKEGKAKTVVYEDNYHTDRDLMKITWFRKRNNALFSNKTLYSFNPVFGFRRLLAKEIKEGNYTDFIKRSMKP